MSEYALSKDECYCGHRNIYHWQTGCNGRAHCKCRGFGIGTLPMKVEPGTWLWYKNNKWEVDRILPKILNKRAVVLKRPYTVCGRKKPQYTKTVALVKDCSAIWP